MENPSPDDSRLPVAQIRIARPTDRLAEVVCFYRDALGLEQISSFEGHAGYEGVMLALPGPTPTKDNLLVFYAEDDAAIRGMAVRLRRHGHEPASPRTRTGQKRG
jgi:catechol 2,3-dioxygenase-like lactoylglutathione lyase family enzyme